MNYYAAPMEGLTDRVWRQAHQKWFGPAGNADRYYAPLPQVPPLPYNFRLQNNSPALVRKQPEHCSIRILSMGAH